MLSAGVPLKVVSEVFGHASVCDHRRHLRARQSRGFARGADSAQRRPLLKKVVIKGGQKVKPIMKPSHWGRGITPLTRPFVSRAWRDLSSRPLDPQIGPRLLSCVNHISPVSIVDRWRALSSAGVVRSWSVVSPHSPGALVICQPLPGRVSVLSCVKNLAHTPFSGEVTAFSGPRLFQLMNLARPRRD
jgi:hypothetical protein